jgi:hypothetical protein
LQADSLPDFLSRSMS